MAGSVSTASMWYPGGSWNRLRSSDGDIGFTGGFGERSAPSKGSRRRGGGPWRFVSTVVGGSAAGPGVRAVKQPTTSITVAVSDWAMRRREKMWDLTAMVSALIDDNGTKQRRYAGPYRAFGEKAHSDFANAIMQRRACPGNFEGFRDYVGVEQNAHEMASTAAALEVDVPWKILASLERILRQLACGDRRRCRRIP
jgi:hypothetical protein